MKRGELWWADLGAHRPREQTGRRPVVVWQSDALLQVLHSVLVVPLTTNMERARLAGTAIISATDAGPPTDSVALAFQMRAIRVEVGIDGTWGDAVLGEPLGPFAWRPWSLAWEATPGEHVLSCRASDARGNRQPLEQPWNLQGMGNNLAQSVLVTVR